MAYEKNNKYILFMELKPNQANPFQAVPQTRTEDAEEKREAITEAPRTLGKLK
jgi:hypothetical protein